MIEKLTLEKLKLSKIICGTNQFVGITHRINPIEILAHLRRFKLAETVAQYMLHLYQEHGINCCLSSPRDKIYKAIKIVEKETGEKYHWICSPSRRKTAKNIKSDVFHQIDWCVKREVSVCLMQRGYVDRAVSKKELIIGGKSKKSPPYPEVSNYIREKGMIPGITTHLYEALLSVEKNNYDAPLLVTPLNKVGFASNSEPKKIIEFVNRTERQIIAIKPMAAGRIPPREGLGFTLKNIKKNDFMSMGFKNFKHCIENGEIVEELLNSS